jgi:hypothetical protein
VPWIFHFRIISVFLALLSLLTPGCVKTSVTPVAAPSPPSQNVDPCADYKNRLKGLDQLQRQSQDLTRELTSCRNANRDQRIELQRMRVALLEKEARNLQLEAQLAFQKQMADEAVIEVVRAKAKLRTIESRAEAAATMAEAEIAVQGMKDLASTGTIGSTENLIKADGLLKMSANEFKEENYGGALYLAGQAKIQIKAIRNDLEESKLREKVSGEVAFLPPLALKLIKRSNLRTGPDLSSAVERVLENGTPVVGYSHKDEWIRVRTESGEIGWVHQRLVDAR